MFGFNYAKPGKGVEKRDPNKKRISIFFEIFFRKLWNLCKANMLYVIVCIPTFLVVFFASGILTSGITDYVTPLIAETFGNGPGDITNSAVTLQIAWFDVVIRCYVSLLFMLFLGMGPVTAGLTYVLRNYSREEHVWLLSDMWQRTKSNFWQGLAVWAIDVAVFMVMTVAIKFYLGVGGAMSYLAYVIGFFAALYIMMHLYIYQLMVTFELKLKDLYRNSMLLAFDEAPKNFVLLAVMVLIHVIIPYFGTVTGNMPFFMPIFILLEFVVLFAATGFMTNFFVYSTVEKFIVAAQESDKNTENV